MSKLVDSPFLNVFLFSFFWAVQIFISKLGFLAGAKVVPFTIQSGFVALIILSIFVLPSKFKEVRSLPPKILFGLLAANGIHFFGIFLSYVGTALTSAINAGFLVQFSTVTTFILAYILLREKANLSRIITIVLIIIGSFYITTRGQLIVPHIGDLLILLACLCWSTGNVTVRKVLRGTSVSGDVVSFLRPIAGLPLLLMLTFLAPFYPLQVRSSFQPSLLDSQGNIFMLLNGTFTALVWIFLNRTLKIATASYMTMMSSMTPVLVAVLAIIFLKETVDLPQALGIILIILSTSATQILKVDKQ